MNTTERRVPRYDTPEVHSRTFMEDPMALPENPRGLMRWVLGAIALLALLAIAGLVRAEERTHIPMGGLVTMGDTVLCNTADQVAAILNADAEEGWQAALATFRQLNSEEELSPDGVMEPKCTMGNFLTVIGPAVDVVNVRGTDYFIVEVKNPRTGSSYYLISKYPPAEETARAGDTAI